MQPPDLSQHPPVLVRHAGQRPPSPVQRGVQLDPAGGEDGPHQRHPGQLADLGHHPVRQRRAAAGDWRRRQLPHRRHRRTGRDAQQRSITGSPQIPGDAGADVRPARQRGCAGQGRVLLGARRRARMGNFIWPNIAGHLVHQPRPVAVQELPVRRAQEVPVPAVGLQRVQSPAARAGRRAEPEPDVRERRADERRTSACCRPTTSTAGASSSWRSSSISEAASRRGGRAAHAPARQIGQNRRGGSPHTGPRPSSLAAAAGCRSRPCMWGRASALQGMWGRASALQGMWGRASAPQGMWGRASAPQDMWGRASALQVSRLR